MRIFKILKVKDFRELKMGFSRKSSILIVSVILLWSGIQGQLDGEFIKICDLCNMENLVDCNSTNSIHINMTITCEMKNRTCTLGINELFEGIDNSSLQGMNRDYICIFKDISSDFQNGTTNFSTIVALTEDYELPIPVNGDERGSDPISVSLEENQSGIVNMTPTGELNTMSPTIPTTIPLTSESNEYSYTTMNVVEVDSYPNQDKTEIPAAAVEEMENSSIVEPSIAVPTSVAYTKNWEDSKSTEKALSLENANTHTLFDEQSTVSTIIAENLAGLSLHHTENTLLEEEQSIVNVPFDVERDKLPGVIVRSLVDTELDGIPRVRAPPPPPPVKTVSCYSCTSSTEEACLFRVDELKTIDCPKQSGCISYFLDGNVVRNCSSSVSTEISELCQKPNNITCDLCSGTKCNIKPWTKCFQCNSKDDPNCSQFSVAETVPFVICPNYNDKCAVRITNDGDTIRECSLAANQCEQDDLCSICDEPLCNSGVFPANRLNCIQCQECEDFQDPNTALPCQRYNPNDQCFLFVTAKSKMFRGCVSNAIDMQECVQNEPKCITCAETNGCNSAPLMKDPSLSCSKCNSKIDPRCAWAQPEANVSKCVNKFLYYLAETCMTDVEPSTQEVVRDCSFDYGACTPEDKSCQSCSDYGCNRENIKVQECIQCSSDQPGQKKCSQKAEGILPTKCPQKMQLYETRGCFSLTKGNVTTRGCVAGLTADDLRLCRDTTNNICDLCEIDGCNNLLAPNLAAQVFNIHVPLFSLLCSLLLLTKPTC